MITRRLTNPHAIAIHLVGNRGNDPSAAHTAGAIYNALVGAEEFGSAGAASYAVRTILFAHLKREHPDATAEELDGVWRSALGAVLTGMAELN